VARKSLTITVALSGAGHNPKEIGKGGEKSPQHLISKKEGGSRSIVPFIYLCVVATTFNGVPMAYLTYLYGTRKEVAPLTDTQAIRGAEIGSAERE